MKSDIFSHPISNCEGKMLAKRAGYSVVHDSSFVLSLPTTCSHSAREALLSYGLIRKKS